MLKHTNLYKYIKENYPDAVQNQDFLVVNYNDGAGPILEKWDEDKLGAEPKKEDVDNFVVTPSLKELDTMSLESGYEEFADLTAAQKYSLLRILIKRALNK